MTDFEIDGLGLQIAFESITLLCLVTSTSGEVCSPP